MRVCIYVCYIYAHMHIYMKNCAIFSTVMSFELNKHSNYDKRISYRAPHELIHEFRRAHRLREVWHQRLILEIIPTFIRRTLASRRSCFTVFWAIAKLLVAALLLDMTEFNSGSYRVPLLTFRHWDRIKTHFPARSFKVKRMRIHFFYTPLRPQSKQTPNILWITKSSNKLKHYSVKALTVH